LLGKSKRSEGRGVAASALNRRPYSPNIVQEAFWVFFKFKQLPDNLKICNIGHVPTRCAFTAHVAAAIMEMLIRWGLILPLEK
jgi:hypothetical protein